MVRLPTAGDNIVSVIEDGDNKCLQVEIISSNGCSQVIPMGSVSTTDFVVSFDINLRTEVNEFRFCITDGRAGAVYPLRIYNGVLQGNMQKNAGKLKPGKWYTVTAMIDFTSMLMDLYLGDRLVLKDCTVTKASIGKVGNIGEKLQDVRLEFSKSPSPSKLWFDNLRIYEGKEIKDFNTEFDASSAITVFPSDDIEIATMATYTGGFHKKSGIMFVEGAKKNMLLTPYEKDGELMVSAADAAELFKKEYEFNAETKSVTLGGIEFKEGSSKITVGEDETELGVTCETTDGLLAIPVFKAADALGLQYAADDKS